MLMRQDWTRAGLATLAAFSITACGYWLMGATPKDAQPPTAVINQPTLTVDGCQIKASVASNTAAAPNMAIQPGPLPAFALEATNPGSTPATIHFNASLRLSSQRDILSRVPTPPAAPVWHQDFTMTLQPGQTQTVPIATGAKIEAMGIAMLSLGNDKQQIEAVTLSAAAQIKNPTSPAQPAAALQVNNTVQMTNTTGAAQPAALQGNNTVQINNTTGTAQAAQVVLQAQPMTR